MSSPPSSSRYEALLPIGSGGVAQVSVGRRRGDSRLVALKRAHAYVREAPGLAESLKREAQLASRLDHPNIVSVLDVEELEDELVLVLDYVEGCTLRALGAKLQKTGVERPREVIRVVLDVATGLQAAHDAGLVHRDVSPSNVLLGLDGVARIADFGIAKAQFDATDRTETGVLKGKSSYMAPEYVLHQHAKPASDLFSLAVLCWEALTGTRLFKGATDVETLMAVAAAEIRPMAPERPALAPLDPVLARALARAPEDRQASAAHFARELEAVAEAHGLLASHGDVGALVRRLFAQELAERGRLLDRDEETMAAPLSAPHPPSVIVLPQSAPVMPVSTPIMVPRSVPSVPVAPVVAIPRPATPPVTAPGRRKTRARQRARRDLLALLGALALLGVALALLAHRLRSVAPLEEPVIVRASATPGDLAAPLKTADLLDAGPPPPASASGSPASPRPRSHRRGVVPATPAR